MYMKTYDGKHHCVSSGLEGGYVGRRVGELSRFGFFLSTGPHSKLSIFFYFIIFYKKKKKNAYKTSLFLLGLQLCRKEI